MPKTVHISMVRREGDRITFDGPVTIEFVKTMCTRVRVVVTVPETTKMQRADAPRAKELKP